MSNSNDGKPIYVTSHGQLGGITAHTVNFVPQDRSVDAGLANQIVSELPRNKKTTVMAVMGDTEALQFALKIHKFLRDNNFPLAEPEGVSQGMFTAPVRGLMLRDDGADAQTFIVGSRP